MEFNDTLNESYLGCISNRKNRLITLHVFEQVRCTISSKINDTPKGVRLSEKLMLTVVFCNGIFDRINKFDLYYYGQINSQRVKSSETLKWASKHLFLVGGGGNLFCWRSNTSYLSNLLLIDCEFNRKITCTAYLLCCRK